MKQLILVSIHFLFLPLISQNIDSPNRNLSAIPPRSHEDSAVISAVQKNISQFAEYPGGDLVLLEYIKSNITYPQMEKDNHIEGKVWVSVRIDSAGNITESKILEGVSAGLNREAQRMVKKLKFIPAKNMAGSPTESFIRIPVEFRLPNK